MNDFDRFLELQLRQMLDPVVATRPPRPRRLKAAPKPVLAMLAIVPPAAVLGSDANPAVEAVPLTLAVTALPQL